jgi:peroxiredoxin Q/BCP
MQVGDVVEDFQLPDQFGAPRRLSELLNGQRIVLFFYPAAMTGGCTKESCHFRDLTGDLAELGARPVGISTDSVPRQKQFADLNHLDYPLLSDADGTVARIFGVKRRFGPLPVQRKTFVIGADRRVVAVIASELSMNKHADEAVVALRADAA